MALAPFWMDDLFSDPEQIEKSVQTCRRMAAACCAAKAAYLEQADLFDRMGSGYCSAGPSQAARQAFLKSLGLQIEYETADQA